MTDVSALYRFCSRDSYRSYLSTPFVIGDGDYTYATNGHMAARLPGRLTDVDQASQVPSIVKMFEAAESMEFCPFDPVTAPDATLARCDTCDGIRYVIDCEVCEGTGSHECGDRRCNCEHDCGNCAGKGVLTALRKDEGARACSECEGTGRELDRRGVHFGDGLAMQWRYVQAVQSLPGPIEWAVPQSTPEQYFDKVRTYGAVAFRGPGWLALILPIRTSGVEAIQAERMGVAA